MDQDWKNNPKLAGLDQNKLRMLQNLADQGSQKSASDMLPFLLSAANQGKKQRPALFVRGSFFNTGSPENGKISGRNS